VVSGIGVVSYPIPVLSGAAVSGAGVAINPLWPAGHRAGDIGILLVQACNQPITTPDGWTLIANTAQGSGVAAAVGSVNVSAYWRRATGATETGPFVGNTGDHQIAQILVFRNTIAGVSPIDVSAGAVAASATAVSMPAVVTTGIERLIVAVVAHAIDAATAQLSAQANANLLGLAEMSDVSTVSGNGGGFAVTTGQKATAGSTGATAGTLASASVQALFTFALLPPTGFLIINGIVVGVEQSKAEKRIERLGTSERAYAGNRRSAVRAEKQQWAVTTGYLLDADADTLEAVVALAAQISCSGDCLGGNFTCEVEVISRQYVSQVSSDGLGFMCQLQLALYEV
jgi:hypothetical protein